MTRSDRESLVLMSQREADARAELLTNAGTLITVVFEESPLSERMASRYPWMYALNQQDRQQCTRDLINTAGASFATQQPHLAIAAGLGCQAVEWLPEDATGSTVIERP